MNPLSMTLKKSIGIKAGLNRDELTIDFSEIIPDEAVMVAIYGDNGTGKSSMMGLGMSPHLNPPQFLGNVADQFYDKGERELKWEHSDVTYRSMIRYHHTKSTKKTEAYLHVRKGDQWQPMALPDHTVSDGKTSTYNACLTHILGPQSVYYLSAFRAQNAPQLADYDDPKRLMRELLNLDEVKRNADKAHDVRREMSRVYEGMRDQVEHLKDLETLRNESAVAVKNLDVVIDVNGKRKAEANQLQAKAKAEYQEAVSGNLDKQRLIDERKKVEQQLEQLTQRHNTDHATLERDVRKIMDDISSEKARIEAAKSQATGDIENIDLRIKKKQLIIGQADQIEHACNRFEELCTEISKLDAEGEELRRLDKERSELSAKITVAKAELNQLLGEGKAIKTSINDCNRRSGFVDQVPCKGQGEYAKCPALKDAMDAPKHAIELEGKRTELLTAYKECNATVERHNLKTKEYADLDIIIPVHSKKLTKVNAELQEVQRISNLKPELKAAEEDIELAKAQKETIKERLKMIVETHEQRSASLEAERVEKSLRVIAGLKEYGDAHDNLVNEIAELPELDQNDALAAATRGLDTAERELREATEKLERAIAMQQQRKADHESAEQKIEAGKILTAKAARIESEIRFWGLLVEGLKGVVDLSIEDAGPGIADYANRLLREAYGPRFTLGIVTQRQQQNGKTVECFDISVIDADTGIESSIINKSGGETVWLDKALTDAVGLYHQDAAGVRFGTLFADEAEDGLTAERKRQFYEMDRAALKMGGFSRRYFISHNPEAWSMADAVIDLAQYKRK